MKTIWRIEDLTGQGMYTSNTPVADLDLLYGKQHPGPTVDHALGYTNKEDQTTYRFGFATLTQYRAWVNTKSIRASLASGHFRLIKYRVPDQYFSKSAFQAIFKWSNAEKVLWRSPDFCDKGGDTCEHGY